MTIYVKGALLDYGNICDSGVKDTADAIKRLNITPQTKVTMQCVLRELGVSSCVFGFSAVTPEGKAEAAQVLGKFMLEVAGRALQCLTLMGTSQLNQTLTEANILINKRSRGKRREGQMAQMLERVKTLYEACPYPQDKYWLKVYMHLLSPVPDYLATALATVALLDGFEVVGARDEAQKILCNTMAGLLGDDPTYDPASTIH